MWLYRIKRLLAEREILVGLGILGIVITAADLLNDFGLSCWAATVRGLGLFLLVSLLSWEFWLRPRLRQALPVPVIFTELAQREKARAQFDRFVQDSNFDSVIKVMESLSSLRREDLVIQLIGENPRSSSHSSPWHSALQQLLHEWEHEIDGRFATGALATEKRCYHILPQVVLPLAFSLGAAVDLRRSVVVYHGDSAGNSRVLDLTRPRSLFGDPTSSSVAPPGSEPDEFTTLREAERLILHLVVNERHPVQLNKHPAYTEAANAALFYHEALNPKTDWLPYVQWLVRKANPLITRYPKIELCLMCPSAVAFALGMAFSRMPRLTVCHWFGDEYRPVISLDVIEKRLPFD